MLMCLSDYQESQCQGDSYRPNMVMGIITNCDIILTVSQILGFLCRVFISGIIIIIILLSETTVVCPVCPH